MENRNIEITMEEYKNLIRFEVAAKILKERITKERYSIDRDFIANIFGFEVPYDTMV